MDDWFIVAHCRHYDRCTCCEKQTHVKCRPDITDKRPHDALFWRDGGYQVVLADEWKLQVVEQMNKKWLFNMKDDPTEKVNLAEERPTKIKELQDLLDNYNRNETVPPLWPAIAEWPTRLDKTLDQPWDKDDEYVIWSN